jgi:hypothetical protein
MAEAMAEAILQLATKADLAALRTELKAEIEILKRDVTIRLGSMIVVRPGCYSPPKTSGESVNVNYPITSIRSAE